MIIINKSTRVSHDWSQIIYYCILVGYQLENNFIELFTSIKVTIVVIIGLSVDY